MGGNGGYKREDFPYNHPLTAQLDEIEELVRVFCQIIFGKIFKSLVEFFNNLKTW
jgi:hypothetical protein